LLAGACSSSGSHPVRLAKIGVVAPLDAGLVQFGRGIRNSVRVAVDEANRRNAVPGWRFEVDAVSDASDAATGEARARRLAAAGAAAFVGRGGSLVSTRVVPDGTPDFHAVTTVIAPLRPDLVFFGGEYDVGAQFSRQVTEAGITVPVMGGDGIKADAYIAKAG